MRSSFTLRQKNYQGDSAVKRQLNMLMGSDNNIWEHRVWGLGQIGVEEREEGGGGGVDRRRWKPKRNWSSCQFCNSNCRRSSHNLDRMSKEGLEISQPVYTGTLYLQRAEKYLPLTLGKKNGARAMQDVRGQNIESYIFFVPPKPHRKFDDSLG